MKRFALILACSLGLAGTAQADCFVEYKAKQDTPLRLHYGVLALDGECPDQAAVEREAARRLDAGGWTLLTVLGASPAPPSELQKANAGDYFLRF